MLWGLLKLRLISRFAAAVGVLLEIIDAFFVAWAERDALIFFGELALVIFDINTSLHDDVTTAADPASYGEFVAVSFTIYAKLWILWMMIYAGKRLIEEIAVGDDNPDIPLYLVVLVIFVPLQLLGQVIIEVVSTGVFEGGFITPYGGVIDVFMNLDIWLEPLLERLDSEKLMQFADISPQDIEFSGNESEGVNDTL